MLKQLHKKEYAQGRITEVSPVESLPRLWALKYVCYSLITFLDLLLSSYKVNNEMLYVGTDFINSP
jgi:hypothetical protein